MGCVGQDGESRFRVRPHVAVQIAPLEAIHFRDVVESHAVSVAVDEEERSFGGLEFVGAEIVRPHGRRFDVIEKIQEAAGHRIKFLPFGFGGRAFENLRRKIGPRVVRFLDPSFAADRG